MNQKYPGLYNVEDMIKDREKYGKTRLDDDFPYEKEEGFKNNTTPHTSLRDFLEFLPGPMSTPIWMFVAVILFGISVPGLIAIVLLGVWWLITIIDMEY